MRDLFRFLAPRALPPRRKPVPVERVVLRDSVRALFVAGFDTLDIARQLGLHESLVMALHDEARAA